MATPVLNTTSSIVDFLKSSNQDSSYSARNTLYQSSGLADRLGTYTGSGDQNTNLLKYLSTKNTTVAPSDTTTPQTSTAGSAVNTFNTASGGSSTPDTNTNLDTATNLYDNSQSGGFSYASFLKSIGLDPNNLPSASSFNTLPSADTLATQAQNNPTFQNELASKTASDTYNTAQTEANKTVMQNAYSQDVTNLKKNFEQRGLFFSGDLVNQIGTLTENLAASKLGADRQLANTLLQSNYSLKQDMLNQVQSLITQAQNKNTDAIKQLNEAGLAIVGNQLVPTQTAFTNYQNQQRQNQTELTGQLNKLGYAVVGGKLVSIADTTAQKDQQTTVNNLIQTYPDAGILPTDNLITASNKASNSTSFQNKNVMVRAVVDPVNGGITYYYSKGGSTNVPGAIVGGGAPPVVSTGGVGTGTPDLSKISSLIKPALENAAGVQYIDLGKVAAGQIPLAQRTASQYGIPLLAKADADIIQQLNQKFLAANTLIDEIKRLSTNVLTANNDQVSMGKQAAYLKFVETFPILSQDNNAKQFIAERNSVISLLTKGRGEVGQLTELDVQKTLDALPAYGDNKELAAQKAQNLSRVLQSVFNSSISAYVSNSIPQGGGTSSGGGTSGGQTYTAPDGKTYVQGPDGLYYPQ